MADGPHFNVTVARADHELLEIQRRIDSQVRVDGAASLVRELAGSRVLAFATGHRTLDLIAHTRGPERLLRLGDFVVDGRTVETLNVFQTLQDEGAFVHVTDMRLIGCETASSAAGRATILALADLLGMPVFGTQQPVHAVHFGREGFRNRYRYLLISDAALRNAKA